MLSEDDVASLSAGLMRERVNVTVNKLVLDYDLLLIMGHTFPAVTDFSGGNKYLFPGISGQTIIDMFTGSAPSSPIRPSSERSGLKYYGQSSTWPSRWKR